MSRYYYALSGDENNQRLHVYTSKEARNKAVQEHLYGRQKPFLAHFRGASQPEAVAYAGTVQALEALRDKLLQKQEETTK